MELEELELMSDNVLACIACESFTGQKIPDLEERIATYHRLIYNYSEELRKKEQLTYKGRIIRTPAQFKKACEKEGWTWLVDDATREDFANA